MSVKSTCQKATSIASQWHGGAFAGFAPERVESFDCAAALHSFDQVLVQCDQRGSKKAVAFVYRSVAMSA